jgi:hypothetical protein
MPFLSPKSKHLPYLGEFLAYLHQKELKRRMARGSLGTAIGMAAGVTGLALVYWNILREIRSPTVLPGLVFVAILLAVWLGVLSLAIVRHRRDRFQKSPTPLHLEAASIASAMLASRRLHKELDGPAATLLEESSRFWFDIHRLLNGPFWRSPNLPSHWESVREQTITAADQAMEEQIVVLSESFHPTNRPPGLQEVLEDVVEKYFTGIKLKGAGFMPVGFDHARAIAEKLKLAASEIERATYQITQEETVRQEFSSHEALDFAIGDLRAIQEAETELRQGLGGS